jgi:serine/threonine protein kinase
MVESAGSGVSAASRGGAGSAGGAPDFEPRPGQLVAGRWRIERTIGRGGMATVFEATDLELDERVALKQLGPGLADDEDAVNLFKQEIRLARKIVHRNVCRIHDFGTDGARKFVTMELVEGRSLAERLGLPPGLSLAEKLEIFRDVLVGLRAAHAAGILHRDIKPANVMLSVDGRSLVMDFGIARPLGKGPVGPAGTVVGTPAFMAPERLRAQSDDVRSDIFSLGVLLYQMITGHLPFEGATPVEVDQSQRAGPPAPPSRFCRSAGERLDEVILEMIDLDPAERFDSVDELLESIAGIEGGSGVHSVLVVDAEPAFRHLVELQLASKGISVLHAESGEEAMERILRCRPSLALVDVELPGMDGLRVVELLRGRRHGKGIPMFLFTEKKNPQYEAYARRHLQVESFFHKPLSVKELGRLVGERLAGAPRPAGTEEVS